MGQERLRVAEAFAAYLHDSSHHPDVTVHHGGQTLSESGETVTGLVLVLEAPSLEAAQAFVGESPLCPGGHLCRLPHPPVELVDGTPRLVFCLSETGHQVGCSVARSRWVLGGRPEGWFPTDDAQLKLTRSQCACLARWRNPAGSHPWPHASSGQDFLRTANTPPGIRTIFGHEDRQGVREPAEGAS